MARIIEETMAANKAGNEQEEKETEKEVVQETVRPRYSKPVEVRQPEPEPVDTDYLFEDDFDDDDVSEAYDINQPQRVEEEDDDVLNHIVRNIGNRELHTLFERHRFVEDQAAVERVGDDVCEDVADVEREIRIDEKLENFGEQAAVERVEAADGEKQ